MRSPDTLVNGKWRHDKHILLTIFKQYCEQIRKYRRLETNINQLGNSPPNKMVAKLILTLEEKRHHHNGNNTYET